MKINILRRSGTSGTIRRSGTSAMIRRSGAFMQRLEDLEALERSEDLELLQRLEDRELSCNDQKIWNFHATIRRSGASSSDLVLSPSSLPSTSEFLSSHHSEPPDGKIYSDLKKTLSHQMENTKTINV